MTIIEPLVFRAPSWGQKDFISSTPPHTLIIYLAVRSASPQLHNIHRGLRTHARTLSARNKTINKGVFHRNSNANWLRIFMMNARRSGFWYPFPTFPLSSPSPYSFDPCPSAWPFLHISYQSVSLTAWLHPFCWGWWRKICIPVCVACVMGTLYVFSRFNTNIRPWSHLLI